MFNFREFIKKGFIKAVGNLADYQIILNASGYYEKGVLTDADMEEINYAIEAQYIEPELGEEVENFAEEMLPESESNEQNGEDE